MNPICQMRRNNCVDNGACLHHCAQFGAGRPIGLPDRPRGAPIRSLAASEWCNWLEIAVASLVAVWPKLYKMLRRRLPYFSAVEKIAVKSTAQPITARLV